MQHRILVLGASGFIGQRLIAALAASTWAQPVALSRRASAMAGGSTIERIDADASSTQALIGALKNVTSVVNCVAGSPQDMVATADALLAAIKGMERPPRIVNLSSLAVYGNVQGTVDETMEIVGSADSYSQAKVAIEKCFLKYPLTVTLRPGIVYGPGSPLWSRYIAQLLVAGCLGDLGARGQGVCNLVHVDDVVATILDVVRRPDIDGSVFNLASPSPPTWNQYFLRYGIALGISSIPAISPLKIALELYVLSWPRKLAQIWSEKFVRSRRQAVPPLRPWLLNQCRNEVVQSVHKAELILGAKWTPLDYGLQQTANWFLAETRS